MAENNNNKIDIRGVCFDNVDMTEAVGICEKFLAETVHPRIIHTPNAEIVQLCIEKPENYELINSADLVIPDGAGVILASRLLGRPLKKGKVAGIELCENLIALASKKGFRVYFLGGKPGIAEQASQVMKEKYPGLVIAGTHDGYFGDDRPVIEEINGSGCDILLICFGVPRQEKWMNAHKNELHVKLMGGFGGSFDIYAGVSKRAPKLFIRLGLEWFYRLLQEPKRIGRMMKLPKFILGTVFCGRRAG